MKHRRFSLLTKSGFAKFTDRHGESLMAVSLSLAFAAAFAQMVWFIFHS